MLMKNETFIKYFYMLPFSGETRNKPIIITFFFLIYVVGVLINSSIITAICLEVQLHKPMYFFICNLSILDILFTSVTVPKLLHMLLSGDHIVSSSQCYTQWYIFSAMVAAEGLLLCIMAYDRYVAICIPLHYHQILSQRKCTFIILRIWAAAFLNSLVLVLSALNMSSCHSNIIHQFFCDAKSLTKRTCMATIYFSVIIGIEIVIFAFVPFLCTFISYFKVFSVIFKMKSKESRRKAFSTCLSHITVISIYYGASLAEYLIPSHFDILDSIFEVVFSTITPMLNPVIYSVQNSNVQSAMLGLVKTICFAKSNLKHLNH